MRYPLIIGNWKLNGSINVITKYIKNLLYSTKKTIACRVLIAIPVMYLLYVKKILNNSKIELCAQNVDINISGAYTGDISAKMLRDIGVKYVIIGHSERRNNHNESNEIIAKKFQVLKSVGLVPILCIDSPKKNYDTIDIKNRFIKQINIILKKMNIDSFKDSIIAYEPFLSIGTGIPSNPEIVQSIHKFMRNYFNKINPTVAKRIIIIYGGSITKSNFTHFLKYPDIDGLMIGKESMNFKNFSKIINFL